MIERANHLLETADGQLTELVGLLSARGEDALRLPCPGRGKMGDGTVAACASHTADRYQRIGEFLGVADRMAGAGAAAKAGHRIPRFLATSRATTPRVLTRRTHTRVPIPPRTSISAACSNACALAETPSPSWLS
jgi:hypothetical protein